MFHHRPSESLSTEVVSLQKQEMTLLLVCGGVWVLCYLHLLAETISLQSWLSKYEISKRSHEKSGVLYLLYPLLLSQYFFIKLLGPPVVVEDDLYGLHCCNSVIGLVPN